MQSASGSTLFSSRWIVRALPAIATVLTLAPSAISQSLLAPSHAAATVTTLTTEAASSPAASSPDASSPAASGPDASSATTFAVHISPAPQATNTRGTVEFVDTASDGTQRSLGSALVAEDGSAKLVVSSLPAGDHSVSAVYSGAEGSAASTSNPQKVNAEAVLPDFALSATPATLSLDAGVQGSVAISVTPANGFSNYVSLSCAGLPLYATCTFLPSNVSVKGAASSSTMTLNTVAPSGRNSLLRRDDGLVYAFLLPGALGLIGLGFSRSRGIRTLALVCVVVSLMGGASSCAQRYRYLNFGPSENPGTPNGESIIRIYGTSVNGALSNIKCFQITLNVTSTNNTGTSGNILTPCS